MAQSAGAAIGAQQPRLRHEPWPPGLESRGEVLEVRWMHMSIAQLYMQLVGHCLSMYNVLNGLLLLLLAASIH